MSGERVRFSIAEKRFLLVCFVYTRGKSDYLVNFTSVSPELIASVEKKLKKWIYSDFDIIGGDGID